MGNFNIDIDISETITEFSLTQSQSNEIIDNVKKNLLIELHRNWVNAAQEQLNSTRRQYIRSLQIFDDGIGKGGIRLIGTLPNMVENGVSAFDMKAKMLQSSKIRLSKTNKPYLHVPFRYATPDALGSSEVFVGIMPKEIYDIINSKDIGESLTKSDIPEEYSMPQTRQSIVESVVNKAYQQYVHKSSMFEGLMKTVKNSPSGVQQSQYGTMRTISENSDPSSWIHKGIQKHDLSSEAMSNTDVDVITNNTVDKYISEL